MKEEMHMVEPRSTNIYNEKKAWMRWVGTSLSSSFSECSRFVPS